MAVKSEAQEVEHRAHWSNWAGDQRCAPVRIVRPRTRAGLAAAIGAAAEEELAVKVSASGHSFTDIALTSGLMVRIDGMNRVLDADPPSGRVKVEAGIVLGRLTRRLDKLGLAFENLGDIDHQSLAGSISTGTHGTGARLQNVSAQVEAVEMVLADGTWAELTPGSDADAFRAARVGLGALGAIYAVTLRTVPAYTIRRVDQPAPLEQTLDALSELADAHDHFELYVFPHTDTALLRKSERTEAPPDPDHPAKVYAQEVVLENWLLGAAAGLSRLVPSVVPSMSRLAARALGRSTKVDSSFRVFASERRIKFTEMEYGIPREHASEAVRRVLEIAGRPELAVGMPIEVRFVAPDDALLSPSHERDTCYIAVHMLRGMDWRPYFEAVEAVFDEYGGRPHWGKRHTKTAKALEPLYPQWGRFIGVRDRLDPGGRFRNAYTDRVLGPPSATTEA